MSDQRAMSDRKVFQDSVTPLPQQAGLTPKGLMLSAAAPEHRQEVMTILFSLAIPPGAEADLEARVAKGEVVPLGELQQRYAASPAARDELVSWLKKQGYKIAEVSGDGTTVYARARCWPKSKLRNSISS